MHCSLSFRVFILAVNAALSICHAEALRVNLKNCEKDTCILRAGDALLPCQNTLAQRLTPNILSGYGTIGGVFKDRSGRLYAITNAHVASEGEEKTAEDIVGTRMCVADRSSIVASSGFVFGEVVAANVEYDAAIVRIHTKNVLVDCSFPPGFISPDSREIAENVGKLPTTPGMVFKYGATTGWTNSRGKRFPTNKLENIEILNINQGTYHEMASSRSKRERSFEELFESTSFAQAGDSGALIFNRNFEPTGILLGSGGRKKSEIITRSESAIERILSIAEKVRDLLLDDSDPPREAILAHDLRGILVSRNIMGVVGRLEICKDTLESAESEPIDKNWMMVDPNNHNLRRDDRKKSSAARSHEISARSFANRLRP